MADERPDGPDGPEHGPSGEGPAQGSQAGEPGHRPDGKRPGGKPYAGGKPGGRGPYRKPGGPGPYGKRPYGGPPGGRSGDDAGPRDRYGDRGPRSQGAAHATPSGGPGGRPRQERRVEYGQRDRPRGPRPPRGPWDRERGPRQPRGDWERRDRFAPPRPARGPAPAEVLNADEEIVAGRRPVEEAFAARREAKRLLVVPERRAALDQLVLHATTLRIPVVEVEGGTITAVSGFDGHQGVALVVAPRRWATLDEVLALAKSRGEPPFVLALDHLEDPQNVGTLLRSAEACGVHGVLFPTRGAAPISPAAIKTSAGAVEHLLLVPIADLASGLVDLHARGLRVIGADGDASLTVREADMRGPIVIVTGSEGRGLNAKVRKRVDLMARIPMRGKVASLNASVAGSVFLFEAAAQRDLPESPGARAVPAAQAPRPAEVGREAAEEPATAADPTDDPTAMEPAAGLDDLLPEAPPPAADETP